MVTNIIRQSSNEFPLMTYHYKILRFTLRANINDFVRTKGHRMKLVPFNEDYVNCDQEGRLTTTKQNLTGGMIIAVLMQFRKQKRRPKTKSPELQ